MRWGKLAIVAGAAGLLVGGAAAGAYAFDAARSGQIAAGVSIAGIDVGGMKTTEVEALLRRRLARPLARPVVVSFRGRMFTLPAGVSGVRVDVRWMVDAALERSRSGGFVTRVYREATGGPLDARIPLRASYSHAAVAAFARRVTRQVHRAPHDASVVASAFALTRVPSRNGLAVRQAALVRAVEAQLLRPGAPHRLTLPTRAVRPRVSTAQLPARYPAFITISRGNRQLRLWEHLRLARVYTIAVGRIGLETPAGLYHVLDKEIDPSWHVPNSPWAGDLAGRVIPPGPDDPLKARWLGIFDGAGIHGTADIASLGTAASHGCIRMSIPDVIELFDRVSVGTPVYID